ncbi:hypothetical protein HQ563_04365 [bacterium]|nr:hypothetical protein [bacterium]
MRKIVGVLLFFGVLLAGCGNSVEGTYVNKDNSKEELELKSEGKFFLTERGMSFHGDYEVKGEEIIFKLPGGMAAKGKIKGDVITDNDGKTWVKKK